MDLRGQSLPAGTPVALRAAGALVAVEGVALALLGVGYAVSGLVGTPEDRLAAVLAGAFAVLVGLGLLPVARGLGRARSWALAPTVVTQVMVVVVGIGLLQGGVLAVGVPVLLLGAAVLGTLTTRDSREAFRDGA